MRKQCNWLWFCLSLFAVAAPSCSRQLHCCSWWQVSSQWDGSFRMHLMMKCFWYIWDWVVGSAQSHRDEEGSITAPWTHWLTVTEVCFLPTAAALIQVDLSQAQTKFNSTGDFNISSCPINFYGRQYKLLQVSTVKVGALCERCKEHRLKCMDTLAFRVCPNPLLLF